MRAWLKLFKFDPINKLQSSFEVAKDAKSGLGQYPVPEKVILPTLPNKWQRRPTLFNGLKFARCCE